jgi:very-short-patch-repair endonuclease
MADMADQRARKLRRNATEAEKRLWSRLRDRQLAGRKFRRQVPIGPYVVDFFCPDGELIVELDGGQHAIETERDDKRTRWLESEGYRVIRFWNNDVLGNTDGVLDAISRTLDSS